MPKQRYITRNSNFPEQSGWLYRWLVLLSALFFIPILLTGCEGSDIRISVIPEGLRDSVNGIDVIPRLNSSEELAAKAVHTDFKNFVVQISAQSGDLLTLRLEVLDADRCLVASGQGALTISAGKAYEVRVPISYLPESACVLHVEKYGPGIGRVVSSPPGIDCPGTCDFRFAPDTKVELTAQPSPPWYFNGWAGSCEGRDNCTLTIGRKAHIVKLSMTTPPVCSSDGWCWENPRPLGQGLLAGIIENNSVYPSWIIGKNGTILSWKHGLLVQSHTDVQENLNAFDQLHLGDCKSYGTGGVIVGDRGTILICEMNQWVSVSLKYSSLPQTTYENLYGVRGGKIVGANGTIIDGVTCPLTCWKRPDNTRLVRSGTTPGVDLMATDGKWAVGTEGVIVDIGSRPEVIVRNRVASNPTLYAVNDNWAVGAQGVILRYQNGNWQSLPSSATKKTLYSVISDFAVGEDGIILRWDGTMWYPVPSGTTKTLRSVVALSDSISPGVPLTERYAFGDEGTMLRWDGMAWKPLVESSAGPFGMDSLVSIGGSGVNDVWVSGRGLYHWDGIAWKDWGTVQSLPPAFRALWCANSQTCYATVSGQLYHWDGSLWQVVQTAFSTANYPGSIVGFGPADVWVTGKDGIYHWNGIIWQLEEGSPKDYVRIFGNSPENLWASENGNVFMRKNGKWGPPPWYKWGYPQPSANSAISFSSDDVWMFYSGIVFRPINYLYYGTPQISVSIFQERLGDVPSVWGSSSNKIWAISNAYSGILKYSGVSWQFAETGAPTGTLQAVWGAGPNDVWAVGSNATILRYRP